MTLNPDKVVERVVVCKVRLVTFELHPLLVLKIQKYFQIVVALKHISIGPHHVLGKGQQPNLNLLNNFFLGDY